VLEMQGMVSGIAGGCFFFPFFPHDDDKDDEEEEKRRRKRITRITKNTRAPIAVVMLVGWRRYGATAVRSDDAAAILGGTGSDPIQTQNCAAGSTVRKPQSSELYSRQVGVSFDVRVT